MKYQTISEAEMDESDDEYYDSWEIIEDEQNFDNNPKRSYDLHSTGRVNLNQTRSNITLIDLVNFKFNMVPVIFLEQYRVLDL